MLNDQELEEYYKYMNIWYIDTNHTAFELYAMDNIYYPYPDNYDYNSDSDDNKYLKYEHNKNALIQMLIDDKYDKKYVADIQYCNARIFHYYCKLNMALQSASGEMCNPFIKIDPEHLRLFISRKVPPTLKIEYNVNHYLFAVIMQFEISLKLIDSAHHNTKRVVRKEILMKNVEHLIHLLDILIHEGADPKFIYHYATVRFGDDWIHLRHLGTSENGHECFVYPSYYNYMGICTLYDKEDHYVFNTLMYDKLILLALNVLL